MHSINKPAHGARSRVARVDNTSVNEQTDYSSGIAVVLLNDTLLRSPHRVAVW